MNAREQAARDARAHANDDDAPSVLSLSERACMAVVLSLVVGLVGFVVWGSW